MKHSHTKIILLPIVSLLVLLVLFSNIGQNFKIDITSPSEVINHYKKIQHYSSTAKSYQAFINTGSNYIRTVLKQNKFEPLLNGNYIDSWQKNIPIVKGKSTLEVFDNSNHLIKSYQPVKDFLEDYRGNITSGTVKSKALYKENFSSINEVLKEILLFDGYTDLKSNEEVSNLDAKLKSLGASGIISPFHTDLLTSESGYYRNDLHLTKNSKGIAKFLVKPEVFTELTNFAEQGFKIKIHSGGEIASLTYKNVHAYVKGKNPGFKPLVINVYYDGPYKITNDKFFAKKNYLLPAALVLDCARVINKQRLRKPDRTIVFNFLCGYSKDNEGFKHYKNYFTEDIDKQGIHKGFQILLDGFGLGEDYQIDFGKSSANLASNISYFMRKSDLIVESRKANNKLDSNIIRIFVKSINEINDISIPNSTLITNTNHSLLSLVQDECYNINLLTGNFRQLRVFERSVRRNSAILALVAILLLAVVLFKPKKSRNVTDYK